MRIAIIGLGHLGTVAAGGLAAAGHEVVGLDIDERKVRDLQAAHMPIHEPGLQECVSSGMDRGNLSFAPLDEFHGPLGQIVLIAAGTPSAPDGQADLKQVRSALAWIRSRSTVSLTILMKSTVPPGSGAAFVCDDLKGTAADYVANPEFLREGRALQDWFCPDRIVLGAAPLSGNAVSTVKKMYAGIEAPFLVTDITSAEMIKYANNAFLATRISFMNEMASLCDAVGASIDAVSEGLALDGRTGSRIHAGVGYGGSCLPKDIRALKSLAHSAGLEPGLLGAVEAINDRQRQLPLQKLQARFGSDLEGLQVGVLGLAFKPGTDDVREAASVDLIHGIVEMGAKVKAFDPQASKAARNLLPLSVDLADTPEEVANGARALVLLTEWPEIVGADWEAIAGQMRPPRFLFDGRNALDARRVARLGFEYTGVGRGNISQPNLIRGEEDDAVRTPAVESRANRSIRHLLPRQGELRYA